jgi:hypothetical protein
VTQGIITLRPYKQSDSAAHAFKRRKQRVFIASSSDFRSNFFKTIKIASIQYSIEFLHYSSRKEYSGAFK